jgi:hypothetical protein
LPRYGGLARAALALAVMAVASAGLAACGTGATRADPGRSPILPSSSWRWSDSPGRSPTPTGRHLDKGETPPAPTPGGGGGEDPLAAPVCSALRLARKALTDAVGAQGPSQATSRELTEVLRQLALGAAGYATAGRSEVAVHIAQLVGALGRVERGIATGDAGGILGGGAEATRLIVEHFTGPDSDVACP